MDKLFPFRVKEWRAQFQKSSQDAISEAAGNLDNKDDNRKERADGLKSGKGVEKRYVALIGKL